MWCWRRLGRALAGLLLILWATAGAFAAEDTGPDPERYLTVDHFLDFERVADPQISPDGARIVYTRGWVDEMADRRRSALWIMRSDGSRNRFLADGSNARWSADGERILFLAEDDAGDTQIFVRWMDAEGATSQVTRVRQSPRSPSWSPDGQSIAFLALAPAEEAWKIDMPDKPEGAEWTKKPRIVDDMHYRQDRRGFMEEGYLHLFVVPAEGGTPRQLTSGEWNVGARHYGMDFGAGFDWTPDGKEIVFDALKSDAADETFRVSHLYAVDVASEEIRQITTEKGSWADPVVSPDGKTIAFVGFPWVEQTFREEELYAISLDGSGMRSLTPKLDRSPRDLHWAPDGSGVYFAASDSGARYLYFAGLGGGASRLTGGMKHLELGSVSRDGAAAAIHRDIHEPGDVVRLTLRAGRQIEAPARLTRVNEDVLAGLKLGEVDELWYESEDGTRVQGWLVKPPEFDPAKKYPLILHIHGGPHAMYRSTFIYSFQNFAAHGYLVLYTNPRGSSGYGSDFGNAIDNAYPSVDYPDLMAGVDAVIEQGIVDTDRMYVTGVSGGGVLSSWTIGHTDRFAAAAVRAPVTNWISFAGTTDITAWGFFRFRTPYWEDPDLWLRHSPLMHVHKVKTPTLLMTGELDLRTPMGQTEEYYQALKTRGVEAVMMRFHDEYHGTGSKPSNFMRTQLYLMSWFGRHSLADRAP